MMQNGVVDSTSSRPSRGTTTISTIAIKAGAQTRLTLAVLKSTDWVFLRVDEMQPSMLAVGRSEPEANSLRDQHAELMSKLQAKQSNIEELLSKADRMVADQADPDSQVYEAMAEGLGEAWKELSRQLQARADLLDQAVQFFSALTEHDQQMDRVEAYLRSGPQLTEVDDDAADKHEKMKLDLLDSAVRVMTYGQRTIQQLREVGAFVDNEHRPRRTMEACAGIEDAMLAAEARRRRLDSLWLDRKSQLDLSQQACRLIAELRRIEDWTADATGQVMPDQLADSETGADTRLRQQERLLEQAKDMRQQANRVRSLVEQLVGQGYEDGGRLQHRCLDLISRLDQLIQRAEEARQNLTSALAFFKAATQADAKLDGIESEIRSLSLSRNKDTLGRRHADLCSRIDQIVEPVSAQARYLLRGAAGAGSGAEGVQRRLAGLETRAAGLRDLCSAGRRDALARTEDHEQCAQRYDKLHWWLANEVEAFLRSHPDMGTSSHAADHFLTLHRRLAEQMVGQEIDLDAFVRRVGQLEGDPGDPDYLDLKRKADDVRSRWESAKRDVQSRIDLAEYYRHFHQLAEQHGSDLDAFDAVIRRSAAAGEDCGRQLDDQWASLGQAYEAVKAAGDKFQVQSRLQTVDPSLDAGSARACVQSALDRLSERHRAARQSLSASRDLAEKRGQFRRTWDEFADECRRHIHHVSQLQADASLAFGQHFDQRPPAALAEGQERALREFLPRAQAAQTKLEQLMRTAETLASRGDTAGEKERLVDQMLRAHKDLQQTITQFEVLATMTVTFFKNLHQVDEWLDRVRDKFRPDSVPPTGDPSRMERLSQELEAAGQTIQQLLRFARSQGQQIVHRANQPDVPGPIRDQCDKIPGLVDSRSDQWDRLAREQQSALQQYSHATKFQAEINEVMDNIETLRRTVRSMENRIGESNEANKAVFSEIRDLERRVNQTDVRVRSVLSTADSLLAGPLRGNQSLSDGADQLRQSWAEFRRDLDRVKEKMRCSTTYWDLVEQTEEWMRESTDYLVDLGAKVRQVTTAQDASRMMRQLDEYAGPRRAQQEARLDQMDKHARVLYGEEADHKLERYKKRYKEIVDSFVLVGDRLASLADTYQSEEAARKRRAEEEAAQRPAPVRPRFVQALREREVIEGSRVDLECQVTGFPEPKVEWLKDGAPVRDNPDYETSQSPYGVCHLTIEETFSEDSAIYTCRASNQAGSADTAARLTVKETPRTRPEPPVFTTKLETTTVEETRSHVFHCRVTGQPAPVVSWYKNDRCVDDSPDYQISFNNGVCQLRIEETSSVDEARYTCRATNEAGDATTSAQLTVLRKAPSTLTTTSQEVTEEAFYETSQDGRGAGAGAPSFTQPLRDASGMLGSSVRFEAIVSGHPPPRVSWLFNGQPIHQSTQDRRLVQTGQTYSLIIPRLGPEHLGLYTIVAGNQLAEARSDATLSQEPDLQPPKPHLESPHFTSTLVSVVVEQGEQARFEGVITGVPPPSVTWYKDGKQLDAQQSGLLTTYKDGVATLVIPRATTDHTGKYACSASNQAGLATSSAQLVVTVNKEAPDFIQRLISRETVEGTTLQWQTRVTGDPPPKVTWLRNDAPINLAAQDIQAFDEGKGVHVLYIPRLERSHTGQYTCKAENEAGEARSTADLIVRGQDEPARVYYHVTRVYQQNQELGVQANRYHSGPAAQQDNGPSMGVLL